MEPVQGMRMNIYRQFTSIQMSPGCLKLESIYHRILSRTGRYFLIVDIILNIIIENTGVNGNMLRTVIKPNVFLPVKFRFKIQIAFLKTISAGMNTVCGNLRYIWGPVSSSNIGFSGKMI